MDYKKNIKIIKAQTFHCAKDMLNNSYEYFDFSNKKIKISFSDSICCKVTTENNIINLKTTEIIKIFFYLFLHSLKDFNPGTTQHYNVQHCKALLIEKI